jgi:hypothetical protein
MPASQAGGALRTVHKTSVAPRKYLYTSKLSFSACLAENPRLVKIENPGFSARKARRMTE